MSIKELMRDAVDTYLNAAGDALIVIHRNGERTSIPVGDTDAEAITYRMPDYYDDERTSDVMYVPREAIDA